MIRWRAIGLASSAVWGLLFLPSTALAQGYVVEGNQVVIEGKDRWNHWRFPPGTLQITEEGVRPIAVRQNTNAALDAAQFVHGNTLQGGIRAAGSNAKDAPHIEEISKEAYDRLGLEKRGAIEYYRRGASGRERVISREDYNAIDPSQRGSVRYYRRVDSGSAQDTGVSRPVSVVY